MDNLDMKEVRKIAKDNNVELVRVTDGMSIIAQEDQLLSFIQSSLMDKYDLTIKKRDGMIVVYFDECLD